MARRGIHSAFVGPCFRPMPLGRPTMKACRVHGLYVCIVANIVRLQKKDDNLLSSAVHLDWAKAALSGASKSFHGQYIEGANRPNATGEGQS